MLLYPRTVYFTHACYPSRTSYVLLGQHSVQKPQAIVHETESLHGTGQIGYRWTDSFPDPVSSPPRLFRGPDLSIAGGSGSKRFEMRSCKFLCSISPVLFVSAVLALPSSWNGQL